jgi:hypothetical protein
MLVIQLLRRLIWALGGIQVFALVGAAGTGKSFRAQLVAQKHGIDLIVDDGLLIRGQQIIAGRSAKAEKAFLAAIRTAMFHDREHMVTVRRALAKERFRRILVIGTSVEMVLKITRRLGLRRPRRIIRIEDIANAGEIAEAAKAREVGGRHTIPVPAVEIVRADSGLIVDSVHFAMGKRLGIGRPRRGFEKTIVRPEYAGGGKVSVSRNAIRQMVQHCIAEYDPSVVVRKITVSTDRAGLGLELVVAVPYGTQIAGNLHELRSYIKGNIERYTGIFLRHVSITVAQVT